MAGLPAHNLEQGEEKMSLLREIQESLMREGTDIGSIFLKLRLLASRLGSDKLEEWVNYEMEEYPLGAILPDYRKLAVAYKGVFSGVSGMTPIRLSLIKKHVGEEFLTYQERRGVVAVDHLVRENTSKNGTVSFPVPDFIPRLHGKIYQGIACNGVTGVVSILDFANLVFSVRKRVMDLTIKLEKSVPASATDEQLPEKDANRVSITVENLIYGNQNVVSSRGANAQLTVNVEKQNISALINALTEGGIPESDAREFAGILSKEQPTSKEEPLGEEGTKWWATYLKKAAEEGKKIAVSALTKLVTEAVAKFHGLG